MGQEGSAEIRGALTRLLAAYNTGDAATIAQTPLLDWRVFGAPEPPDPRDQQERLRAVFAAGLRLDLHWRQLYVQIYGDVAIASGYIGGWVSLPGEPPVQEQWRFHKVWLHRDQAWRLAEADELPRAAVGLLPNPSLPESAQCPLG